MTRWLCGLLLVLFSLRPSAYVLGGQTWAVPAVNYRINTTNANGLAAADIIADVQRAASAWPMQAGINFSFAYVGASSTTALVNDGQNNVFFRGDSNGGFAGETRYWWDANNHLLDFDTVIYEGAGYSYTTTTSGAACNPANGVRVDALLTHELGHALGLGHSAVTTATMYPYMAAYCDAGWSSLDPDDIAGARALYGVVSQLPPAPPTQVVVK